jgi:hypothetical protein
MSSPPQGSGRIVAELGRPETPEETAARRAENSRAHRANQTTRNLVLALLASLVVVLFIVLVVVRPSDNLVKPVDYRSVAAQAQQSVSQRLVDPELPKAWSANDAQFKSGSGKTVTWYLGFITPKQQFIGVEQGIHVSSTWVGSLLGKARVTGHVSIDGVEWTEYNQRHAANPGNFGYSLAGSVNGSDVVLHGSADDTEFSQLATAIVNGLK